MFSYKKMKTERQKEKSDLFSKLCVHLVGQIINRRGRKQKISLARYESKAEFHKHSPQGVQTNTINSFSKNIPSVR